MICQMEVLDPSGHVTLKWDPDNPESVAKAEAEFDRLVNAGFAFFTSDSVDADRVDALDTAVGSLDGRLEKRRPGRPRQTRTFAPRAERTTAVPPLRAG